MSLGLSRARLGSLLAVALGALALLALPAIATAKHGSDGGGERSNGRENAGTVASYDTETGELEIALTAGGTAAALVTDETRIRCVGAKRGGHRHHSHRGRGRGHQGEDSVTESRRGGRKARQRRHRGHRCGDAALTEGAVIRKARIDEGEEGDAFTKILVEKPKAKGDCDKGEGTGEEDDDGPPDQGSGDS
ncbi:MAG: hypothetical protein R2725_10270 [Solirubrobacterales bacterium]